MHNIMTIDSIIANSHDAILLNHIPHNVYILHQREGSITMCYIAIFTYIGAYFVLAKIFYRYVCKCV